jgi:hypothetical protein
MEKKASYRKYPHISSIQVLVYLKEPKRRLTSEQNSRLLFIDRNNESNQAKVDFFFRSVVVENTGLQVFQ